MKPRRAAVIASLAILLAACADGERGPGAGGPEPPQQAGELILRVDLEGGLVPLEHHLGSFPVFALYSDGEGGGILYQLGPQIAIYPGPAMPNVLATPIEAEGVRAILEAAEEAGLTGPDRHFDLPTIMDAPTTVFTLVANGRRHVVSAYALAEAPGDDAPPGSEPGDVGTAEESPESTEPDGDGAQAPAVEEVLSAREQEARAKLAELQTKLWDLGSWLPEGSVGEEAPAPISSLRVVALPYESTLEPGLEQREQRWPLDEPLARFGEPFEGIEGARCGVVDGQDLATLLPDAQDANELTPWTSEGERHRLTFRPLLPDESGCELGPGSVEEGACATCPR